MAWIRTLSDEEAAGELQRLFQSSRDPETGQVDEILRVHSLHPPGLAAHLGLYQTVMRGTRGLPKVEREWIAFVVSALNGCEY